MKKFYLIALLVIVALLAISSASSQEEVSSVDFNFVSVSNAGVDDAGVNHEIIMTGFGSFAGEEVEGGGTFQQYDANTGNPAAGEPATVIANGTWQAERIISWSQTDNPNIPYGRIISGILEVEVRLYPDGGPEEGEVATLKVICNSPPAAAFTGLPEGYFLETADGLSFKPGTFPETTFPMGVTLFTQGADSTM